MVKRIFLFYFLALVFLPDANIGAWASENAPEEVWRIDCGASSDYTDHSGNLWVRDENFFSLWRWGYTGDPVNFSSTAEPIGGTDLQGVYQTALWGNLAYKVDVPSGTYRVTLMFSEPYWDEAGRRVFDVALEGNTLWHNVDIFTWAGNRMNTAMNLTADVNVADGSLDVTFPVIYVDYPTICGIEVEALEVSDDAFLDFIERKMFWFFWNNANPQTGLVKWGENNWAPGYANVSSIASDGFALSVYTIGARRGWVSEYDAYQRVIRMLDSFDTLLPNLHGFWYHLVNMETGQREGASEVSTVDSALFILGALQAGEYFKDTYPDVAAKADELYRRMDWTYFTGIGDPFQQRFVDMGWKPENDGYSYIIPSGRPEGGYFCNDWWNRYCESILVNLLALGSPTHPISPDAWRDMTRGWADAFGYHFIQEPPLFTHQYHHLYYNLSDKCDDFTDYFLNTEKATLVNRQTCIEDPRYEPKRWGLTGCGSPPNGEYAAYGSYPGGSHDGTVAPTAPAASLVFTQNESLEAVRYMFFKYKQMIWGLHGFCDSFNIQQNFRNQTASALNNGAMIIGIENYRSGLIMNTFMNNQYVQGALAAAKFKDTPQVSESSYKGDEAKGAMAFDGNLNTRWASEWVDTPQWVEMDYKTARTFNKMTIHWETACARSYKIQVSNNRINWTDVYSTTDGNGGIDEVISSTVTGRYLRIYCTERATQWGQSIWEVTVDNDPSYWVLNMPEMDWYQNAPPYNSTGGAVCQMILNYIREGAGAAGLYDQRQIYEYARNPGPYDGIDLKPDEVDKALGHFDPYDQLVSNRYDPYDTLPGGNPYQGYNYSVDTYNPAQDQEAMNKYMRDICHWMAYTVTKENWWDDGELAARPNTPAAIPVYGRYDHWVAVKGCVTSTNPAPEPHTNPWNTPDFTVYGFWMKDPLITGMGRDTYKSAAECAATYFLPLSTGDSYNGLLLQVAEPPQEMSGARAEVSAPVPDAANLEYAGVKSAAPLSKSKTLLAVSYSNSTTEAYPVKKKTGWKDLVDPHLLTDPEAVTAFTGAVMKTPVLVKRTDKPNMDYYLVPFVKRVRGKGLLASAAVILDAKNGYFREASWTDSPGKFLKVRKTMAQLLARRYVRMNILPLIKNKKIKRPLRCADPELVWAPGSISASPYMPYWRVNVGGYTCYVTQDRKVLVE